MSEGSEEIPIKITTLAAVRGTLTPIQIKADSLLKDYYRGIYRFGKSDLVNLLELKISVEVLDLFLDDLLTQGAEASVAKLFLRPDEVVMMSGLVRAINSVETLYFGHASLTEH